MTNPHRRELNDMPRLPPIESRWTWGNIFAAVPATLALLGVIGMLSNQIMNAPAMQTQVRSNTESVLVMKHDIDDLKSARHDDAGIAATTRQEILGRLDRIENKLDQKADKSSQARGWVR
jgi:hypothetical protein